MLWLLGHAAQVDPTKMKPDSHSENPLPGLDQGDFSSEERAKKFFESLSVMEKTAIKSSLSTFSSYYGAGLGIGIGAGGILAYRNPFKFGRFGRWLLAFGTMSTFELIGRNMGKYAAKNQIQSLLPPDSKLWPFLSQRFGIYPDGNTFRPISDTSLDPWGRDSSLNSNSESNSILNDLTKQTSANSNFGSDSFNQVPGKKSVRYNQYGDPIVEDNS